MVKRLVLCCDGTWNTAGQKCPTNVTRFYDLVQPVAADGTEQRAFYHPGVGTARWERIRGGAFGFGLSRNVCDVYRFIVDHYEVGDELFFIGFSRGAFTARSAAGFVRNAGILRRDEADRVDEAYRLYRTDEGPDSPAAKSFRAKYAVADEVPIRFIGVWDTVGALGVPNTGLPGVNWLNRRWAFHDTKLSSRVQSAFQALAIDEQRRPFAPTLWQPQPEGIARGQQLEQVWFAGVHCDIGGGYADEELAEITLLWMTERATACGLALRNDPTSTGPAAATATLHQSRTGFYKLTPPLHRRLGASDPGHEFVSSTAVTRHDSGGYSPNNLAAYLASPSHHEMPTH